jgi:glutamine amidotransferase
MCRLYGFRANEPTKVECTLAYAQNALLIQSRADRRGVAHADGWGVAWYADGNAPSIERRETAAYRDAHFSHVAEQVYATSVVAHVRKATVGAPTLDNAHPFGHDRWIFAHNGTVRAFDRVEPLLEAETPPRLWARRRGTTDSEAVFLWLLGRLEGAGVGPARGGDAPAVTGIVRRAVTDLATWCDAHDPVEPAKLNFVLTDGATLVATRWQNSLHWLVREGVHDCEICGIPHVRHDRGTAYRAVLVASEPITREAWRPVPEASILTVDPDLNVTSEPIGMPVEASAQAEPDARQALEPRTHDLLHERERLRDR